MRPFARPDEGPTSGSRRPGRLAAVGAILAVLALVLAACDSGGSSSSSSKRDTSSSRSKTTTTTAAGSGDATAQNASAAPTGAEAAIAEWLKGQGHDYAGDCADAKLPADQGKWCSTLKSTDPATGAETYDVGPVGEQPQKAITVKPRSAAQLTPGYQVGASDSNVGAPQQLTREQLEADAFITGNLLADQAAGIGAGLSDLPAGAPTTPTGGTGGGGGGGTGGGGTGTPTTTPGTGGAQYPPTGGIVVTDPTVTVGGEVTFRGSGCVPNTPLTILFDGHPIGTINADPSGAFAGSINIPKGTAPGTHLLTVQGSGCVFNTTITVAGSLAFTGSSSHTATYVLGGIAAVVVGLVLVVGSRRRRRGVQGRASP